MFIVRPPVICQRLYSVWGDSMLNRERVPFLMEFSFYEGKLKIQIISQIIGNSKDHKLIYWSLLQLFKTQLYACCPNITFSNIILVSLDWPWWWPYLHQGYWQILYIVDWAPPPKSGSQLLNICQHIKSPQKIGKCDGICIKGGGYFRMVRRQVTFHLIEKF